MVDWPLQQACNPSWPLHCLMCREHFCHLAAVGAALSVIRLWNRVFIVLAFFYTPALISVRFRTDYSDQRGNNENDDEQPFAGILPSCGSPVQMMQRDCRKLANMSPTNISQIFHQPQTANICWATVHLLLGPDKYRNRRARSMQLILHFSIWYSADCGAGLKKRSLKMFHQQQRSFFSLPGLRVQFQPSPVMCAHSAGLIRGRTKILPKRSV